jgi:hypothetical protein
MADLLLIKSAIKGFITFIPGVSVLIKKGRPKIRHSGADAEFCYSYWLRMLVFLSENGNGNSFKEVGEIGNGGSLGIGFCALLTGCDKYYALETEELFEKEHNLKILDEIIFLFRNETAITQKFRQQNITINNFDYPRDLIDPVFMNESRISEIRNDIIESFRDSKRIKIIYEWEKQPPLNLHFIFSRAVMEHVFNPEEVYRAIRLHLVAGSLMLHDIEFHSHGITKKIDGHFLISSLLWKIIFGRRTYYINRWNLDEHCESIIDSGFELLKKNEVFHPETNTKEEALFGAVLLAKRHDRG